MAQKGKTIGLFFGSFNPIHIGHLIIAECIAGSSLAQEVWFVVSPHNPLKNESDLLHAFDRLEMVERAIADNYKLKATDVEFHLPRPSYTIHTLEKLSAQYPQHHFRLIMGEDNLHTLPRWKAYETILEQYGILVYPRPAKTSVSPLQHSNIHIVQAPVLEISASLIRQRIKQGLSVKYMVPEPVEQLIHLKKFYI